MVKGYLLAVGNFKPPPTKIPSPDTMTYTWVTITDTLIALPLRAIRDSFIVVVRAVDNTFKQSAILPEGAIIHMTPQPYWDKDTNGMYDAGDVSLNNLQQAADPKSLGLLSMRERAAAFGGTVEIRSEAGRGTTLCVCMPQA